MTTTTKPTLSPDAASLLDAAYLAPQRMLTNRPSPAAEELLAAGYVAERPGIGLVITEAGQDAWATIHRDEIEAAKRRLGIG